MQSPAVAAAQCGTVYCLSYSAIESLQSTSVRVSTPVDTYMFAVGIGYSSGIHNTVTVNSGTLTAYSFTPRNEQNRSAVYVHAFFSSKKH